MAQISKITLPSGTTYDIKDATARAAIQALTGGDAVVFVGVSSTELTDGGTQKPTVNSVVINDLSPGQLYFYGTSEFIWGTDSKWHELGSLESLGALAYKDDASGSYTPAGTVSQPTFTGTSSSVTITATDNASGNYQPKGSISGGAFTGSNTTFTGTFTPEGSVAAPTVSLKTAGSTTTIKNPTSVTVAKTVTASAPGATAPSNAITYYSVSNEILSLYQLGYTTGDSITTSNVTVKNGDAEYQASSPAFTGTQGNVSTSGTPNGSNGAITFTGTKVNLTGITTATGSVSQPTFTGTEATVTVS